MIARGEFEPSRCAAEHRNSPNGWAIYDRFALFCFGGVLPLLVFVSISIWMEPSDAISATDLTSRVKRMTVFPNTAPFIPLIGYALLSLGLVCVNFDSYANRVVVRAGVFTGIVLSLQFQAMFSIGGSLATAIVITPFAVVVSSLCLVMAYVAVRSVARAQLRRRGMQRLLVLVVVLILLAITALDLAMSLVIFRLLFFLIAVLTPAITCTCYSVATYSLLNASAKSKLSVSGLMFCCTWTAAYLASMRASYVLSGL